MQTKPQCLAFVLISKSGEGGKALPTTFHICELSKLVLQHLAVNSRKT